MISKDTFESSMLEIANAVGNLESNNNNPVTINLDEETHNMFYYVLERIAIAIEKSNSIAMEKTKD